MKSPDRVCEKYSLKKSLSLKISRLDKEMVLIEGNKLGLEFLGNLIKAQADFKKDCGFSIHPNGAGRIFFKKRKGLGVYIHLLPCLDRKAKAKFKKKR